MYADMLHKVERFLWQSLFLVCLEMYLCNDNRFWAFGVCEQIFIDNNKLLLLCNLIGIIIIFPVRKK